MKILINNIRILSAIVFFVFASAHFAFAQTETQIAKIRAEVAVITKAAANYKKTTKSVEEISLEGTEATYFADGADVRKIAARIYGESYNETAEFYYQGGELIFAYVRFNKYDAPLGGSGKSPKIASREEHRFYFANGELIRLLVGKKELKTTEERYSEMKDEIIRISKALKDA